MERLTGTTADATELEQRYEGHRRRVSARQSEAAVKEDAARHNSRVGGRVGIRQS